jgi:hypothetical protein
MIEINSWMTELTEKLQNNFKNRLLFVGLQGSYQRNEANKDSDIDAVVILDVLSIIDLTEYRKIISTMPASDKACGFISGQQELINWPKHELFQFKYDTLPYLGTMDDLLPEIRRQDIVDSIKISVSGIYHSCCHTVVHSPVNLGLLKSLYKSAFFTLQAVYFLRNNIYIGNKKELRQLLSGDEKKILDVILNWELYVDKIAKYSYEYYDLLLRWSSKMLTIKF